MNPRVVAQSEKRQKNFSKWWRKNHHRHKAHVWLAYYARNFAFSYALPPEAFGTVQTITKRFFASEHKRLKKSEAIFLWRITHPLSNDRNKIMLRTAESLKIAKEQLKQAKKEQKNE